MPSSSEPATPAGARGWLLDTNVISELRKGARCDRAVAVWAARVPPVACFLSRVTVAEIVFGIERVTDPAWLFNAAGQAELSLICHTCEPVSGA
jgi:predicted nucleic acid-binding protein